MRLGAVAALALLVLGAGAQAQPRDQFDPRDTVTIDPAKSYIFYRTNERGALVLLREAGAAGQETPPARDRFFDIWWQPRFTSGEEGNSYLRAVEPGSYVIYGNMMIGPGGAMGLCLCMGSLRFEAQAGRIVDLGEIVYTRSSIPGRTASTIRVVPHVPSMPVPARLEGLPRVAADFHAADKLPNYLGVEIDRHPAMPGVLAYDRDRVIDLRTGHSPGSGAD